MGKEYVPVVAYIYNGTKTPKQFYSKTYKEWIKILKVTDSRRRASLDIGAVGIRYKCIIDYNETKREIYLFDEENDNWWIEDGNENEILLDKNKICRYCKNEILNPIIDKHQGRVCIVCPYCRSHLSEWSDNIEKAKESWNTYIKDEN